MTTHDGALYGDICRVKAATSWRRIFYARNVPNQIQIGKGNHREVSNGDEIIILKEGPRVESKGKKNFENF